MDSAHDPGRRKRRAGWVGTAAAALLAVALTGCASSPAPATGVPGPAGAPGSASVAPSPQPTQTPQAAPSPEVNPAGDIPDNQAYVPFEAPGGLFTVSVPEGWARTSDGPATVFTDKLNAVRVESASRPGPPTVESARAQELPALAASLPGFAPGPVTTVTRPAGPAVLVTYQAGTTPTR